MKACLGQYVSASLPKAHQIAKAASTTLMVKRVSTKVSETDFKELLELNKIIYAKADHLTSRKDGRVLQVFKLKIKEEAEAEALISQNLTCHTTNIIYKVEEFRSPVSVQETTCGGQSKIICCHFMPKHGCPSAPGKAFTFLAKQLGKFVENVAIQVTQSQVCYVNSSQDAIDKKSSVCCRVSEAAKTHLDAQPHRNTH